MKPLSAAILTLTLAVAASAAASEGIDDVLKLSRAGVSQDVMLAFVQTSNCNYDPSADEIKLLRDTGVSATVIVAMIDHAKESGSTASSSPAPAPAPADNYNSGSAQPVNAQPPSASGSSGGPVSPGSDYLNADNSTPATVYAPAEKDANISYFYQALAPSGTWHQTANYGWAWRPSVVSVEANWRPYCNDGHWVWSDHGWYWESNYSWGWAAFHYGRWYNDHEYGWVWVPDTTWGPAWVNWRQNDQYYGWAPLPPAARFEAGAGFSFNSKHVGFDFELDFGLHERDYAFVSCDRFLEPNLLISVVPEARISNVYHSTTIIRNTYVYNNRVINNGVSYREVATRTSRNIETVQISDAHFTAGAEIRGEVRSRNTIVAFRPTIAATVSLDPPKAIAAGVYVRHTTRNYPTVTASAELAAQRRLTTEVDHRRSVTTTTTTTTVRSNEGGVSARREETSQRQLDAELAAREREHGNARQDVPRPGRSSGSRKVTAGRFSAPRRPATPRRSTAQRKGFRRVARQEEGPRSGLIPGSFQLNRTIETEVERT